MQITKISPSIQLEAGNTVLGFTIIISHLSKGKLKHLVKWNDKHGFILNLLDLSIQNINNKETIIERVTNFIKH